MDPVRPDVDVIAVRERSLHEGAVLGLPGRREPSDDRRRQPRCRSEEPFESRSEVPGRQAVQVEQGQHLGDLRGLAAPRRDDRGLELRPLVGLGVDPTILHARRADPDRSRDGGDHPRPGVAVARDEPVPRLVTFAGQLRDVGVDLGLQGRGEHPLCSLAEDLVQHRPAVRDGGLFVHYAQHRRSFLADVPPSALVCSQRGRYVASPNGWAIHNFKSYLSPSANERLLCDVLGLIDVPDATTTYRQRVTVCGAHLVLRTRQRRPSERIRRGPRRVAPGSFAARPLCLHSPSSVRCACVGPGTTRVCAMGAAVDARRVQRVIAAPLELSEVVVAGQWLAPLQSR